MRAQAQWKRDDVEAEREARCDIVAILKFPIMGGNKIEPCLTGRYQSVAGSRFEK
jgi:hypothetical protein